MLSETDFAHFKVDWNRKTEPCTDAAESLFWSLRYRSDLVVYFQVTCKRTTEARAVSKEANPPSVTKHRAHIQASERVEM